MPIVKVSEQLTLGSLALLLYPQKSCAWTTILFTALKNPWWTVLTGNTTYSPTLFSDTCVSLSQLRLCGVDKEEMQLTLHCLWKDTPFSLDGGLVSLPLGRSTTTTLVAFPLDQRVVTFHFGFSYSINSSDGHFLALSPGLGGSSDVEVAALELFFLDPAILDLIVAFLWLFCCRLRLIVPLMATDETASKPSSPASFFEGFFLVLANLGMMCW